MYKNYKINPITLLIFIVIAQIFVSCAYMSTKTIGYRNHFDISPDSKSKLVFETQMFSYVDIVKHKEGYQACIKIDSLCSTHELQKRIIKKDVINYIDEKTCKKQYKRTQEPPYHCISKFAMWFYAILFPPSLPGAIYTTLKSGPKTLDIASDISARQIRLQKCNKRYSNLVNIKDKFLILKQKSSQSYEEIIPDKTGCSIISKEILREFSLYGNSISLEPSTIFHKTNNDSKIKAILNKNSGFSFMSDF